MPQPAKMTSNPRVAEYLRRIAELESDLWQQSQPSQALQVIPVCAIHGDKLQLKPQKSQASEARFCGAWYECPICHHSFLYPSAALHRELLAQLRRCVAAEYARTR